MIDVSPTAPKVLPARAGVILRPAKLIRLPIRPSRASGGDPDFVILRLVASKSFPRERGDPFALIVARVLSVSFPRERG